MSKIQKIIVIDDEKNVRRIVTDFLKNEGFIVIEGKSGEEAVNLVMAHKDADLMLLDIRMPVMDGYETMKEIRLFSDIPVIFLTALAESYDEVKGLDLGADDYVVKPFSYNVLLARVRATIRKNTKNQRKIFKHEDFVLNYDEQRLIIDGKDMNLTPKEYELLETLVLNKGRIIDRNNLFDKVWGFDYEGDTATLNTHLKTLRFKMADYSNFVHTIRGVGYRFDID